MSRRLLVGVIAAVAALAAAAAPAGASSLTYVKDGNVWLSDPSGAKQYQVTFDGGYSTLRIAARDLTHRERAAATVKFRITG